MCPILDHSWIRPSLISNGQQRVRERDLRKPRTHGHPKNEDAVRDDAMSCGFGPCPENATAPLFYPCNETTREPGGRRKKKYCLHGGPTGCNTRYGRSLIIISRNIYTYMYIYLYNNTPYPLNHDTPITQISSPSLHTQRPKHAMSKTMKEVIVSGNPLRTEIKEVPIP